MRRIIAEDPEWYKITFTLIQFLLHTRSRNLETVSPLTELCIQAIIRSFHGSFIRHVSNCILLYMFAAARPVLNELLPKHRTLLLALLPTTTPIRYFNDVMINYYI